jgi:hypothetical protein
MSSRAIWAQMGAASRPSDYLKAEQAQDRSKLPTAPVKRSTDSSTPLIGVSHIGSPYSGRLFIDLSHRPTAGKDNDRGKAHPLSPALRNFAYLCSCPYGFPWSGRRNSVCTAYGTFWTFVTGYWLNSREYGRHF